MKSKEKHDIIRLKDYPKGHMNEVAIIRKVFKNGDVWLCNMNMPFSGTISKIYTKDEFENSIKN